MSEGSSSVVERPSGEIGSGNEHDDDSDDATEAEMSDDTPGATPLMRALLISQPGRLG
jgi:hypothetical protein